MEKILIRCDHCQSSLRASAEFVGKNLKCPQCKKIFRSKPVVEDEPVEIMPAPPAATKPSAAAPRATPSPPATPPAAAATPQPLSPSAAAPPAAAPADDEELVEVFAAPAAPTASAKAARGSVEPAAAPAADAADADAADADAGDADAADTTPAARSKKDKKKKMKEGVRQFLLFAVGAGVAVLLTTIVIIWMLSGSSGGGGGGGGGAPGAPVPPGAAAALEPQAGPDSWVPPADLASADAAWQSAADPSAPPAGILSALEIPYVIEGFAFAPPALAQAGFVVRKAGKASDGISDPRAVHAFEWVRYDLTKAAPIESVPLGEAKSPKERLQASNPNGSGMLALSPSGTRIAVKDGGDQFVGVWTKEGRRVGTLDTAPKDRQETKTQWLGFGAEDRLWMLSRHGLVLHDVATGKTLANGPAELKCPPVLTPGGKFLVGCTESELFVLNAADGARAGAIPLPKWPAKGARLAMHPAGNVVALALDNDRSDVLLGVWDLATGKRTDGLLQTFAHTQQRMTGQFLWIGERRLLCGPLVVDLELHASVCPMLVRDGKEVIYPVTGTPPDARLWSVRTFKAEDQAKLENKPAIAADRGGLPFLTAASPPEELTTPLREARNGVFWHPGCSFKLVIADAAPQPHRDKIAAALGERLAKQGYRVDPQAAMTLEVTVKLGAKEQSTGKQIPRDQLPEALRMELNRQPGMAYFEIIDVYHVTTQAKVLGPSGQAAFQLQAYGSHAGVKRFAGDNAAWEELTSKVSVPLPRLFLRDNIQQRLRLPSSWQPGVDGLLPPVVQPPDKAKDNFGLPGEI